MDINNRHLNLHFPNEVFVSVNILMDCVLTSYTCQSRKNMI